MDPTMIASVLALVAKGVSLIPFLIEAEADVKPAITAIENLISNAQAGSVSAAQLSSTESVLDGLIEEFNLTMD